MTIKESIIEYISNYRIPVTRGALLEFIRHTFPAQVITDRGMRMIVKEIVADGTPIGASNKGYFIVRTEEDREKVKEYTKKKIFGLWKFYHNIDKAYIKANPGTSPQLSIFTELDNETKTI